MGDPQCPIGDDEDTVLEPTPLDPSRLYDPPTPPVVHDDRSVPPACDVCGAPADHGQVTADTALCPACARRASPQ